MRASLALALVAAASLTSLPARAHVAEGTIPLTVAEANPAVAPPANAGGLATIEVNAELALEFEVTVHDLSGPALAAHLHRAPAGSLNPIPEITLTQIDDTTFRGETEPLTQEQLAVLLAGGFYVNVHTGQNLGGEVRGQITGLDITRGTCSCRDLTRRAFLKCVRKEIAKLPKDERSMGEVKALKVAVRKSSCGLSKQPKKKPLACCLPINEAANTAVSGHLCAPAKNDAQCTALGGTIAEGTCVPTNPCPQPASPSGAFLD